MIAEVVMHTRSALAPRPLRVHGEAIHVAPEASDDGWLIVTAARTGGRVRFWLDVSTRLYDWIARGARVRFIRIEREHVREELCRAEILALRDGRAEISLAAESLVSVSRGDGATIPRT
jgi:hypothetical protein